MLTLSSAAGIRDFDVTFKGLGINLDKHSIGHRTTAHMDVTLLQLAGSQRTSFGAPDPNLKDLDQHGPLEELLA